ncbi:neuronal tyrosine-phosphorylated phosphoinositide-3-kinase adapter 1-like, partial [Mustelus asterias]
MARVTSDQEVELTLSLSLSLFFPVKLKLGFEAGEGGRRIPPLKPKRSPNTQLSVSFDENSAAAPSVTSGPRYGPPSDPARGSEEEGRVVEEEEEPVYIEMVGDVFKEQSAADEDSDHSEAIYEEMKYPLPEEGLRELRWSKFSLSRPRAPRAFSQPNPKGPPHDIPPPFPNLLLHRPPLLAFPRPASQKAYKPQAGSKLPVLQHGDSVPTPSGVQALGQPAPRAPKEEGPSQGAVVPSGRARSHSTPLPPQASGQHRPEKELPTSHTMKALAQSALVAPQAQVYQKAEREAPASLSIISSSVRVTTHSLLAQLPSDQKVDKELSTLQNALCSVNKGSTGTRALSSLYKVPVAHGLLEHTGLAGPVSVAWPYLPLACKRPPAYESLKAGTAQKICPAVYHAAVKTQGQDRASGFAGVCCSRPVANAETRSPPGEGPANAGQSWQRNPSCGRKGPETEGGAPGRSGASESLDKEEKPSGIPVKSQAHDGASAKGSSRSELPQPCPITCQRSV